MERDWDEDDEEEQGVDSRYTVKHISKAA